jgi:murein DD-endopeptidase MepM/ murein hydrolase activator NlpD
MAKTERGVVKQAAGSWTDWWVYAALPLAVVDLALYLALRARPGPVALVLWRWGPPLLLVAIMAVLVLALYSSLRGRLIWSWQRGAALAGVCALILTMDAYGTFPSAYDSTPSQVVLDLPLDGPVTVAWGGSSARTNYHVASPAERWGYDLLVTNDGTSHQGEGQAVTDFFAYDRPVRAPASGLVIEVRDGVPDARPGRAQAWRGGGNYVVLEIAPREYLFLVHLRSGTIRVRQGDQVDRGDVVARVGNSGNTSEPHLHVHLQDSPTVGDGQAVPFYFGNYVLDGNGETIARGMPEGGVRRGRYVGHVVTAAPRH